MTPPAVTSVDAASELPPESWRRLEQRLAAAQRRARRTGAPTLASVTAEVHAGLDPAAATFARRQPGEPFFCFEQPDRSGHAIGATGCAAELTAAGRDRFATLARDWRALVAAAQADPPVRPAGAGLAAFGGFAFAPEPSGDRGWQPFGPSSLVVPAVSLVRGGDAVWMTVNVMVSADDDPEALADTARRRTTGLRGVTLPLLDPDPAGRFEVRSVMPPAHYEEAVARGVQRIAVGELEKLVLAREVEVTAPAPHDPAAVFGVLRDGFPSCYVYAVGRDDRVFLGATPELLIRREGRRASTVALAGSTRRSADPSVDDHLAERLLHHGKDREENAIVARRIVRALRPLSVWVTDAPEPVVVRVANIQHLARPIRAQLADAVGVLELAGRLHPTPAVGGEPSVVAERLIPALEGFDRGWYAGGVGWIDQTDDGEFCVALRCALVDGVRARCIAGCGIVAGSVPAEELAETEVKLGAMLPVLAG